MGFRDDILVAANEVRAFGEKHGIPELTTFAVRRGLADLRINDHRAAVQSYASRRGLSVLPIGPALEVNGDGTMIEFDELNRLARMSTRNGAPETPTSSGAPSSDVVPLARGENHPLPAAQVTITV